MKHELAHSRPGEVSLEFICTQPVSRALQHGLRQAGWISSLRDSSTAQPPAQAHCSEGEGTGLNAGKAAGTVVKFCSCLLVDSFT